MTKPNQFQRVACIAALNSALLSACAINNHGFIAAKITEGDGAIVYETHAPGLHIRTTAEDSGVSFGYSKRTCILEKNNDSPIPGWHYVNIPEKHGDCHATDRSTIGIELRLGAPELSLSIGGRFTTQMGYAAESDDKDMYLFFDSTKPEKTKLRLYPTRRDP
ncbi:MAG: hypothetical protein HY941_05140 [Gammaproteobacteria bacterium]|nr:hypothetical protein [Gammaproteobacteria bacterium]